MRFGGQQLQARKIEEKVQAARDRVLTRYMYPSCLRQF